MQVHFHYSGYCTADNSHVYKGAPAGKTIFPAFWALLRHPTEGWILFDTGYSDHFLAATSRFPNSLYAALVPVTYDSSQSVVSILKTQHGLAPNDIRYIIISHFHGDHIGGLLDFPEATFVCTRMAFEHIWQFPDWRAFTKAYLKDLLPKNMAERLFFIEDIATEMPSNFFQKTWFWDKMNLTFVYLPGHSRGQVGILFDSVGGSETGRVFLVADAAWHIESIRRNVAPPAIVRLFADNYAELKDSIARLHAFYQANGDIRFIVTHCRETLKGYLPSLDVV